jgi:hypothetical protein
MQSGRTLPRDAPQALSNFDWALEGQGRLSGVMPDKGIETRLAGLHEFYVHVPAGSYDVVGSVTTEIAKADGDCETVIVILSKPLRITIPPGF